MKGREVEGRGRRKVERAREGEEGTGRCRGEEGGDRERKEGQGGVGEGG